MHSLTFIITFSSYNCDDIKFYYQSQFSESCVKIIVDTYILDGVLLVATKVILSSLVNLCILLQFVYSLW